MRLYAALFAVGLVVYRLVAGSRLTHQSAAPHFVYQAAAWLDGHANVGQTLLNDDWSRLSLIHSRGRFDYVALKPCGADDCAPVRC